MHRWLLVALMLWLIPPGLVALGWNLPGVTDLNIGSGTDMSVIQGFYAPERNATDSYRWSQPQATLTLPAHHLPGVLELHGMVAPDGTRVTLALGEQARVDLPPASDPPRVRRYQLLLSAAIDAQGDLPLTISARLPEQTVEARPIGLALTGVRLRSVAAAWQMPPQLPLLGLGLFAPLLGLGLRLAGVSWRLSLGVSLAASSLLVGVWVWRPLAVRPLLYDVAALLQAGALWRWWLVMQVVGLAALPLTVGCLRHLPLHGYPFSKALGLLLVGYASWLLAVLRLVPFGITNLLLVLLVLIAVGGWSIRADWRLLLNNLRRRWWALLACEVLFTLALCGGVWLRWHGAVGPAISGTEKPMELALLAGVLHSPTFPPNDPWFAGYTFNYYYMGYVLIAGLKLLSGVNLGAAFNLGMATILALTALTIAGLIVTLIEVTPRRAPEQTGQPSRLSRTAAALLGVLLVLGVGNQMSALQLLLGTTEARSLDGGQLIAALGRRLQEAAVPELNPPPVADANLDTNVVMTPTPRPAFDWWTPSRAIWDTVATTDGTLERRHLITEFPFFSFYLGDLHPHVIALPFATLGLGLLLALLVYPVAPGSRPGAPWHLLGLAGLLVGMLYAINAWYAPTFLLLCAGALALRYRRLAGTRQSIDLRGYGRDLGSLLLVMVLLIAPFWLTFQPPGGTQPVPPPWSDLPLVNTLAQTVAFTAHHTRLPAFLIVFGLFFVVLLAYGMAGNGNQRQRWIGPGVVLLGGMLIGFPLLALLPLALLLAWLAWNSADNPVRALVLWATAVGALVLFGVDIIYIRDYLEGDISRLNTLFKFYYQVWLLWGVLAAYAAWALLQAPRRRRVATLAWAIPSGLLLLGALVYPVGALGWGEPWGERGRILDGLAFLQEQAPDELAAMRWLQAHADPDDVLLTAFCNCDYNEIGRVASVTGQPTLLGWSFAHQALWRSGIPAQLAEIRARERDIPRIYTTTSIATARQLLDQYRVRYVYVGPTERRLYAGPGLAKFARFLDPVFQQGEVQIYAHQMPAGEAPPAADQEMMGHER
jgi:YYY domain-containing protein